MKVAIHINSAAKAAIASVSMPGFRDTSTHVFQDIWEVLVDDDVLDALEAAQLPQESTLSETILRLVAKAKNSVH